MWYLALSVMPAIKPQNCSCAAVCHEDAGTRTGGGACGTRMRAFALPVQDTLKEFVWQVSLPARFSSRGVRTLDAWTAWLTATEMRGMSCCRGEVSMHTGMPAGSLSGASLFLLNRGFNPTGERNVRP